MLWIGVCVQEGVGDTSDSYAYDGNRVRKWNVTTTNYGKVKTQRLTHSVQQSGSILFDIDSLVVVCLFEVSDCDGTLLENTILIDEPHFYKSIKPLKAIHNSIF